MDERAANMFGGLSGVLYVVLWVAGLFVIVGFLPVLDSTDQEVTKFLGSSSTKIWAGGYVALLAFAFLIVFIARLVSLLRHAEGESAWLWIVALGAALAWVSVEMASAAAEGAAFYAGRRGLDLQTTKGLLNIGNLGFFVSGVFSALFLGSVAFVIVRTRVLSRWLGWFAAGVAAASLVSVPLATSSVGQIPVPLRAIWVFAVGVTLITKRSSLLSG